MPVSISVVGLRLRAHLRDQTSTVLRQVEAPVEAPGVPELAMRFVIVLWNQLL
jgi:hypothetical protein